MNKTSDLCPHEICPCCFYLLSTKKLSSVAWPSLVFHVSHSLFWYTVRAGSYGAGQFKPLPSPSMMRICSEGPLWVGGPCTGLCEYQAGGADMVPVPGDLPVVWRISLHWMPMWRLKRGVQVEVASRQMSRCVLPSALLREPGSVNAQHPADLTVIEAVLLTFKVTSFSQGCRRLIFAC